MQFHDPKVELLKTHPGLGRLPDRKLARVAKWVDHVEFPEGTVIVREGSVTPEAFVIARGEVELTRQGRRVGLLDSGDLLGYHLLISQGSGIRAQATALTPVDAIVMPVRTLMGLMQEPGFAWGVAIQLARRLSAAQHDALETVS